jgi:hypothetical protein
MPTLRPKQEAALAALVAGSNVSEAAAKAGVTRPTVSGWLHGDATFRAEYENARAAARHGLAVKVQAAAAKAIDRLAALVDHENPAIALKASVAIVHRIGPPAEAPAPPAESTAEAVAEGWRRAAEAEAARWRRDEDLAALGVD